jgi:hypothetical protein
MFHPLIDANDLEHWPRVAPNQVADLGQDVGQRDKAREH